ncbi:nucleoside recognition domain-containing protein [Fervidibacillus albus]|uniref:Nucleoside recognition domain-containing protein n=1 Tax=Fervidibacillus albus TaxID=2980026 RepID=A0A9E8LUL6_9BACI|nr:nucleoside recognition domain-containing protein [Fervidibacillus albus]WAA09889.1 nucleoside recognition domain-containing protein [Fervidibacillus albus]
MFFSSVRNGWKTGLKTTWDLGKIIFPVTLIVTLLQHSPVLPWIIDFVSPFMGLIGLSGDAAVPLVLGNMLNLYAAIGAILSFDFTVKEVFIIAVMLSFSHNLLVESSVAVKSGVKLSVILTVRIGLALLAATMIHLFWSGGNELAKYGFVPTAETTPDGFGAIFFTGLEKAAIGVFQLAIVVIPLMIGIQLLKDLQWLDRFSKWMAPVTRAFGMKENTSLTLTAGLIFGLAMGAGVLLQSIKEDGVSKKDTTLAFIFLVACHAVIEDTLIFIPLGIPVLPLFIIRFLTAILLTLLIGTIWTKVEMTNGKEMSYGR